jgi:hypothetical protein
MYFAFIVILVGSVIYITVLFAIMRWIMSRLFRDKPGASKKESRRRGWGRSLIAVILALVIGIPTIKMYLLSFTMSTNPLFEEKSPIYKTRIDSVTKPRETNSSNPVRKY